jgi:hypothetical protein
MKKCQLRFEETKQKQHVIAVWEKIVGFAFVIKQFYDENKALKCQEESKRRKKTFHTFGSIQLLHTRVGLEEEKKNDAEDV